MIDTAKLASMMMGNSIGKEKLVQKTVTENWWDKYIFVTSNKATSDGSKFGTVLDEVFFSIKNDPLKTERDDITMLSLINATMSENFGLTYKEEKAVKVEGKKGFHTFRYSVVADFDKIASLPFIGTVNALDRTVEITDYAAYVKACNKCIKGVCLELSKHKMTPTYIFGKEKTVAPSMQYPFGLLQ